MEIFTTLVNHLICRKRLYTWPFILPKDSENIGARRLHTIMEQLLEEVSFEAPDLEGQTITITPEYIHGRIFSLMKNQDLSRYIL